MDLWHTYVTDDAKYAFLLGSALRNDDPEQLIAVYDNLIPEDISQTRLQQIKEEARQISELPEHQFSSLVLNARTYSLAIGRSSMSQANSGNIVQLQDRSSENCVDASLKEDGQGRNIHSWSGEKSCNSLESLVLNKSHPNACDSDLVKAELVATIEDEDCGLQSSCQKVSCVDSAINSDSVYGDSEEDRPGSFDYMPSHGHVRITRSFNPPFDEEVKVDSSTGGSSVESPRSDTSVTQDEYNLADEGTEMAMLSYKETPHSVDTERTHDGDCWDYVASKKRSDDEEMEDEENERDRPRNLSTVNPFRPTLPKSVSNHFDQSISYGLRQVEGNGSGYPNPRITFTSYSQQHYQSDNGERDKTRNKSKDDTDKPEVSGLVDINGNPRISDIASNPQMRQLPRGKSENAALGSLAAAIPQSYTSSLTEAHALDRKKERKRLKLERQKWTPAEAYEDHKDFSDIKDILDYVEGGAASASKAEGRLVKKKPERSRKKDHHLNGTIALEDTAGAEDGSNSVESVAVAATGGAGLDAMGNSSVKPQGETQVIPRADSSEDIFDKNIDEFHDCLNIPSTEIVISSRDDKQPQSDSSENIRKSSSDEADNNDSHSKAEDFIERSVIEKNKILIKKSVKTKSRKDKQGPTKENGPLSLKVNMVKSKESLDMKDSLLITSVHTENIYSFHSSSDTEMLSESRKEDSFTEVKKRKKRLGGKDFSVASAKYSSTGMYHVHNISGYTQRNIPRPRPVTPTLPATVGIVGNSRSLPVTDQAQSSRDLSPSAFPVLLGHGPLTPHTDNRRNSCGDLSADFIDNKTYDSDKESAKSLPDAHRTRIGGNVSPIYQMSYARIAAAPRRNDLTNSPSSESGVASGSQNSSVSSSVTHTPGSSIDIMSPQSPSSTVGMSDRKATVWKGSPRERRHSIGSGPEDKTEKEKSSVAQCSRQCGSQEVLSRDAVTSARANSSDTITPPPPMPAEVLNNSVSTSSLQSDLDMQDGSVQQQENLVSHKPKHSSGPVHTATRAPVQKISSENTSPQSNNSCPQEVFSTEACQHSRPTGTAIGSSSGEQKVASHLTVPDPSTAKNEIHQDAATVSSVVPVPVVDSIVNTSSCKDKLASNPQATKKTAISTKSVIFLDKRFSSSPQNLGITFGFDSSYESVCEPASQSASQCHQLSKPQLAAMSLSDTAAGLFVQVCPTSQAHIPPTDSAALISSDHKLFQSSSPYGDNSNLVPKGLHIQGLCNGLILPSSTAGDSVRLQDQNASSSISNSSENTVTNLASSNRTSLSKLKPEALTNHRIATPNSVSLPRQISNLLSGMPNGPQAQVSQLMPQVPAGTSCVALVRANPTDVIYSPNHPPPPLPPKVVAVPGDRSNTSSSTSLLPSRHQSIPETVKSPSCTECSTDKLTADNMKPPSGKEAVGIESTVDKNKTLTLPPTIEAVSQKQPQFAAPADVIPIVYGGKIKPTTGCGTLMFVLNSISQTSKDGSAEAVSLLRKKWLDVSDTGGSTAFATLNQD
ncbi:unnamed protein product [Candidula unifasciata]|uniref:Uncharacterized protein n=1 Tax=Candidula unifasciata TaxID=100452 RepID=A0A8S4A5J5_9EUPU|nr:unnamed protein product [Candidula unifasciata]